MLQSPRAAKTYVGVFHVLVSYAVCNMLRSFIKWLTGQTPFIARDDSVNVTLMFG